ncbi:tagatose 6-phosphate kinase [Selenomonas sp. WCT3]|uniref:1-phosphofructokinase family hexose kinase n=1 Tax=Selenomonas sp. WCT3 TaxID=3158785 RepID=UPI00088E14E2|nr:tagatose 6-phosphate kinase [Selenomonas ruminantium]
MILVINLNASLDKRYELVDFAKGKIVRAKSVDNTPGGKGIHVANVDTILGEETVVTGFLGGKTGEFVAGRLYDYGIAGDFVEVAGETRSCLAILTEDGAQTEILEPGPDVSLAELKKFRDKYTELLGKADIVVASGSVPRGVPVDFYAELIEEAHQAGKKFLLDTSGDLLARGIAARPDFIKPNRDEMEALRGYRLHSEEDVVREIRHFLEEGIEMAAVSLGSEGSLVGFQNQVYRVTVPKIDCQNPVGSGDSYVAGIAAGFARKLPIEDILRLGAACGTANALEAESGFVQKKVVAQLLPRISVEKIAG